MSKNKVWIVGALKQYLPEEYNLAKLIEAKNYEVSFYAINNTQKKSFYNKKELILTEIIALFKVFFRILLHRNEKIVALGAHYSFFLINRIWGWTLGKKHHIYVYNFYIHELGKKKSIQKVLRFLLNSTKITLLVQSPKEIEYYTSLQIKCKILFVPYCSDIDIQINNETLPKELIDKKYIFTGGYTNRDYTLMLEAAKQLPNFLFVFIPSSLNEDIKNVNIPDNIILYRDVKHSFFFRVMKSAEMIVVALKDDVGASGQIMSLDSMALAKPIVYTDLSSINYYFKNDKTCGIPYKRGNIESLISSIKKMDSLTDKERDEIGKNAQKNYKTNFTKKSRDEILAKVITG